MKRKTPKAMKAPKRRKARMARKPSRRPIRPKIRKRSRSDSWSPVDSPHTIVVSDIYLVPGYYCDRKRIKEIEQRLNEKLSDWGGWIAEEKMGGEIHLHTKFGTSRSLIYQTVQRINKVLKEFASSPEDPS